MYAVVDIETTGAVYKYGKITEIAILVSNGTEIVDSFQTLINPEVDIPYYITRLTGITNEMVKHAPRFFEVARKIVEITAGRVFVAHNVSFDYRFIQEEFSRLGYDFQRKKLCTVKLSRVLFPGQKSYSLGNICSFLDIPNDARHRAGGDAMATAVLLKFLIEKYQTDGGRLKNGKQMALF